MPRIKVHEKALAHLSRGLYRSPASALRELVSNAWDANATIVRIDTNYPNFFQLTIEDNGTGFTKVEFEALMSGGIGNSQKRQNEHLHLTNNRPLIGRLGIGMLGIAQICGAFTITSKTNDGSGFKARVRLYDLLKERLDSNDATLIHDSPHNDLVKEVDVGEYNFENVDLKSLKTGTRLIADDVHPTFVRSFKESTEHENFRSPPLDWPKALKIVSGVHSLQELGDYWKLLWELAAACPIPYVSSRSVPGNLIAEEQKRLESFNFKLLLDGIELRKPVQLISKDSKYSTWRIGPVTDRVYGKELAFHGYIAVQEGKQLKPDELRGIMIRIKNVAIGYYDPTLLDYRYNEGPRAKWITGEIYVDQGLEDALNIDRDSFNRFHPHFRVVQRYIHELLQQKVFPTSYKEIDRRSRERDEERSTARVQRLKVVLQNDISGPVHIRKAKPAAIDESQKVELTKQGRALRVDLPTEVKTKKSQQQLAASILTIFEVALREPDKRRQREKFSKLLLELLRNW